MAKVAREIVERAGVDVDKLAEIPHAAFGRFKYQKCLNKKTGGYTHEE